MCLCACVFVHVCVYVHVHMSVCANVVYILGHIPVVARDKMFLTDGTHGL